MHNGHEDGRARFGCDLLDFTHLDTQVIGFEIDCHTMRAQHRLQCVCDLLADPFLHRKALQNKRTNRVSLEMPRIFSWAMYPTYAWP
jgi:hypothetical protein